MPCFMLLISYYRLIGFLISYVSSKFPDLMGIAERD